MSTELPADVAIETIFVIEATYGPDAEETRRPFRPEHLRRISELRDSGVVIDAGGYLDFSASLVLVRAADESAALAIVADDVYLRNGVWTEVRARPFGRVVRPAELG
jgi:uncharacterized protein YciI